jgi:predicted unusual protein kinase regulating ubiquinone biosynthesis (AarF/ABC1/UbiB family)
MGKSETKEALNDLKNLLIEKGKSELATTRAARLFKGSKLAFRTAKEIGASKLIDKLKDKDKEVDIEALAKSKSAKKLLLAFGEMKGLSMKIGQMLSTVDQSLSPEVREILSLLQTHSQPIPYEKMKEVIKEELGKYPEELFKEFNSDPIASASIGQVYKATLEDGTKVAIKVQYPGIRDAVESDLKNAEVLSSMGNILFPNSGTDEVAEELRSRFLEECDYRIEAKNQKEFFEFFKEHPDILIPKVISEFCTEKVLVTEFHEGKTLDQFLKSDPDQKTRNGNFLFKKDGKIVFLDFGCIRRYDPKYIAHLRELRKSIISEDKDKFIEIMTGLKIFKPETEYNIDDAFELMRFSFGDSLDDQKRAVTKNHSAAAFKRFYVKNKNLFKLTMPPELVFMNRINFGVVSVFEKIDCHINWYQLAEDFYKDIDPTLDVNYPGA